MQKIFLIGYMGSGKTIVGKNLANRLKMKWIDMDCLIEDRYKKSVLEIFTAEGEKSFRNKEQKILREITLLKNIVLSTGGGTPCFFDNIKIMSKSGTVIYLKTSTEILSNRLYKIKQTRPLIMDKNKEEIQDFVTETLSKRELFYNQASIIISISFPEIEIEVDRVTECLIRQIKIRQAL